MFKSYFHLKQIRVPFSQASSGLCCRKGDPFQGPRVGSSLTLRNELSQETRADKARDVIGKGRLGGEQEGTGIQEDRSTTWLAVSGFMVMALISGLSLANHSDSASFLVAHASLGQDGLQRRGFWDVGRTYELASPFDLSQILLVGGGLLVHVPYQDLLQKNNSCKWLLWCLARVGGFSQCFPLKLDMINLKNFCQSEKKIFHFYLYFFNYEQGRSFFLLFINPIIFFKYVTHISVTIFLLGCLFFNSFIKVLRN